MICLDKDINYILQHDKNIFYALENRERRHTFKDTFFSFSALSHTNTLLRF